MICIFQFYKSDFLFLLFTSSSFSIAHIFLLLFLHEDIFLFFYVCKCILQTNFPYYFNSTTLYDLFKDVCSRISSFRAFYKLNNFFSFYCYFFLLFIVTEQTEYRMVYVIKTLHYRMEGRSCKKHIQAEQEWK